MTDSFARPFDGAAWRGVARRSDALPNLPVDVLLHAGPPFDGAIPAPVRRAAMQAAVFEGIAGTLEEAAGLIDSGTVRLMPAQDHGVVTPLAQVVSASMALAVVGDASSVAYAPLIEGPPPALRFGTLDPAALDRLAGVAALGLDYLDGVLRANSVDMASVIAQALAGGDECHGRTNAANTALVSALHGLAPAQRDAIAGNAGFVLPILMATACWHLRRQPQGIAAVGGNGAAFGIRLHGGDTWRSIAAQPPVGPRLAGREAPAALGAIGDSAVIDFCGLGGQALSCSPQLQQEWREFLPADALDRRAAVVDSFTGIVSVARVGQTGAVPMVNLAILDASGEVGLVGRGFYCPAVGLFG